MPDWTIGDHALVLHPVLEVTGIVAGVLLFLHRRRRHPDRIDPDARAIVTTAALIGAALGAKLLHHLNAPSQWPRIAEQPMLALTGRTIVGALFGGTLAVELTKARLGIRRRTGDVYVLPLCLGIGVGRIGCFLAGTRDDTHGLPTTGPLGIDLGDGIARHPTALYEIVFVALLGLFLAVLGRRALPEGFLWSLFLASYMLWRVLVDLLKPGERFLGLTAIQAVALVTAVWALARLLPRSTARNAP